MFYLFDVVGTYFVFFSFALEINLVHPTEWFLIKDF